MRLIVVKDYDALSRAAAEYVAAKVRGKPDLNISFCTGRSVVGFHRELVGLYERRLVSFAKVRAFNLDELYGLPSSDPKSFDAYLQESLFRRTDFDPGRVRLLDLDSVDPKVACAAYEEAIEAAGGIDLQIVGIGPNGHVGLNEPGSSFGSRTRVVEMTEVTRLGQVGLFGSFEAVPVKGVTRGVMDIMRSREVLMLASGESKTAIVATAMAGPVTEAVPSSVLQLHPAFTLIADEAAARDLLAAVPRGMAVERR